MIGLIVLGPKQLPEVARSIGRILNELKRASSDLTSVIVDARDATQKSLLDAREEYNKVLEKAERLEEPSAQASPPADPLDPPKKDPSDV